MEKTLRTIVHRHGDDRYRIQVELPPREGVRHTRKALTINVDRNTEFEEYAECINISATGDLAPEEMHEFIEALHMARRLADGSLVI